MGGNIVLYPYFDELVTLLKFYDFDFHFWIHIDNILNTKKEWDFAKEIIIPFPVDSDRIIKYVNESKHNKEQTLHFFIENEIQYDFVSGIIEATNMTNYQITPIYTGENYLFFEKNIYLSKEDIFASPILHRIIFCNQKLNSNHFGKLYVLSDGEIKANINARTLGNIDKNSLLEVITKELNINTAWRIIRHEPPCNDCLYKYLCPPPSNYETVINKANLCHVQP